MLPAPQRAAATDDRAGSASERRAEPGDGAPSGPAHSAWGALPGKPPADILRTRWELVADSMALGAFELRRDGTFLSSTGLDELCGGPAPTCLDELLDYVAADGREALGATLAVPAGVGSSVVVEVGLAPADGELRPVQIRGRWVGPAASPVLVAVVLTSRSHEEGRLADLAERYRSLTEVTPDIILVHQGGRIVYVNRAALAHVGASDPRQLLGQPLLKYFSPKSQRAFLERLAGMAETGAVAGFTEETIIALDGTEIDIEATSIATTWNGAPAYQAVARVITERKAAERRLREQAALIDLVPEAIIVCRGTVGRELRIASWSKGAEKVYGWRESEVVGRRLWDVLGDRRVAGHSRPIVNSAHEALHRRKGGTTIPVVLSATVLRDDADQASGLILVAADISERKAAEQAWERLERRYAAVIAALEEGIVVVGPDGRVESLNTAASRILAVAADALEGLELADGPWSAVDEQGRLLAPGEWPEQVTLSTGRPQTNVVIGLRHGQATTWVSLNCHALASQGDAERRVVCSISDVSQAKAAREQLQYAATHDTLTSLPNRAGVTDRLARLVERHTEGLVAFFIDLDDFKEINDSLGHPAGDQVLQIIAARLQGAFRGGNDLVGRLAGDEFVALCPDVADPATSAVIAQRLLSSIEQPIMVRTSSGGEHAVRVRASIGVAHLGDEASANDLLVDADVAMYDAKRRGGHRVVHFDERLRRSARRRSAIKDDLRDALSRDALGVAYQPIVAPSGEVVGYEALARWHHPTRGPIPPADFIPVAEEMGLIDELGAYVLRRAARDVAALRRRGDDVYVSVNLSARQLADRDLLTMVRTVLADTGLPATALCLEITEGSVMADPDAAAVVLAGLEGLGLSLAIDDFGTGYSSLAYLERLPVASLKVDRSFIARLGERRSEPTLVAGIISLAHSLGLSVIAEGVETEAQAEILVGLHVDALQGYLYGRPGPLVVAGVGAEPGRAGRAAPARP